MDGPGRVEKPTPVLVCLECIYAITAEYLYHSQRAVNISDNDFKNTFWDIFPKSMKNWLTNDQNIDTLDANNPLDVENIADEMQFCCNIPSNLSIPVNPTRASSKQMSMAVTTTTKVGTREERREAIIVTKTIGTMVEDTNKISRLWDTRNTIIIGLIIFLILAAGRTLIQKWQKSSTTIRPMVRTPFIKTFMRHT